MMRHTLLAVILALFAPLAAAQRAAPTSNAGPSAPSIDCGFPLIVYDNGGALTYDATSGEFLVNANPLALRLSPNDPPLAITDPRSMTIGAVVDNTGMLVSGVDGSDLVIEGVVNGLSGVLLRGEIAEFAGYDFGGPTDTFVLYFDVTGGSLAGLYDGQRIGVQITSESSSFDGTFTQDFSGGAKGTVCATPDESGKSCCLYGKLRLITMRYTGDGCDASNNMQNPDKVFCQGSPGYEPYVFIRASDDEDPFKDDARVWFQDIVFLGGSYNIDAMNAGETKLENETWIHVFDLNGNLLQTVGFHTSCSQPVRVQDQFGSALVVGCRGEDEPAPGDCCASGDKPTALSLQYTGESCAATDNSQDPGKVFCSGNPGFAPEVLVIASSKSDPFDNKAKTWFEGTVALGETFDITARNAGEDELKNQTWIHIYDLQGQPLQTVSFHTSCSQPLFEGDQFGSIRLVGCGDDQDEPGDDCCADGIKPTLLALRYTGEDCSATDTAQDADKVSCDGDPGFAPEVMIVASDDDDPYANDAKVYFEGTVLLDGIFEMTAANAGEDKFASSSWVHIFDLNGNLLQTVGFHTSCSQPLFKGDQFGSLRLENCGSDDGGDNGDNVCADGKPQILFMEYTGEDCSASDNSQGDGKTSCTGDPQSAMTVFIIANDSDNPADDSNVWFMGEVDINTIFELSALSGGETRFKSNTWVHILDVNTGETLQRVQFHTSCSQPLFRGNQFGSLILRDFILE